MNREEQRRWWRLSGHLKSAMEAVGLQPPPTRYDPEYILAAIMEWLEKEDIALTGQGLRRVRRRGFGS